MRDSSSGIGLESFNRDTEQFYTIDEGKAVASHPTLNRGFMIRHDVQHSASNSISSGYRDRGNCEVLPISTPGG